MFFLFNCKLYLKWSKFLWNFTAWVIIETTCIETTLYRNDQFWMQLFAFNLRNLFEEWSAMNASPRIFWNLIGHPGDYVTDFASTHPGTQASSHSNRLALHKQKWKNDKKKKKKLKQAVWVNCLQKLNFRLWSLVLSHSKLRREHEKKSRTCTLKSKDKSDFRFSDISEGQTVLLLPKYRETSSRFCYCSFVCIRVLGKTAGFGCRHYL